MKWFGVGAMSFDLPPVAADDIEYPSSDGEPMGETDWHIEELAAAISERLKSELRKRDESK